MDLVSLETEAEWKQVRARMDEFKAQFIWTSGHICDRDIGNRSGHFSFLTNVKIFERPQMLHRPKFAATLDKWLVLVWLKREDSSNQQETIWMEE